MLVNITFDPATPELEEGCYIGTNVTRASMDTLSSNITSLINVPGYRLNITCRAEQKPTLIIQSFMYGELRMVTEIERDDMGQTRIIPYDTSLFGATTGGGPIFGSSQNVYPYVGFNFGSGEPYILHLGFVSINRPTASPSIKSYVYGEFLLQQVKLSVSSVSADNEMPGANYYTWGMSCAIAQEKGYHSFLRQPDGIWQRIPASSYHDGVLEYPYLELSNWDQLMQFQAPVLGHAGGFGPAFMSSGSGLFNKSQIGTRDSELELFGANTLYAIGETSRTFQEVGMQGVNILAGEALLQVSGTRQVLRYRMTYVPLLVLTGLLTWIGTSLIIRVLLGWQWAKKTLSVQRWREVSVTRLLVDTMVGLKGNDSFEQFVDEGNTVLEHWAEAYEVRYTVVSQDEKDMVRLEKMK